jgi:hypothetical protein
MAETAFSGPLIVFGQSPYAGSEYNADIAPSMFWGGTAVLDPRLPYTYLNGESQTSPDVGWLGADCITTQNIVPYTATAGAIVASASPTGAALALVAANSATTGVYITPGITRADTGALDTGVGGAGLVALDAFTSVTGSFVNGVLTVTANTAMPITPGMQIVSVANLTSGTLGPVAAAPSSSNPPTIVLSQTAAGTGGQGVAGTYTTNNPGLNSTSGTITLALPNPLSCTVPFGGFGTNGNLMWNAQSLVGRAVAVTAAAGATYTTATVAGYDIYGYPMVEAITITAGSQVAGKKAFRYIRSVTLSGGSADTTHAYSVDTTTVFGLPIRSDSFGDLIVNSATSVTAVTMITSAAGYLPSDRTSPATATTGDVRGTYSFTAATGVNKLVVRQSPQAYNIGNNAATASVGFFGQTQFTNF